MQAISVIVPLYNKRPTLARALDSILAQEGVSFEVIVVDDDSNDGSTEVALAYGEKIRYIHQQNAGPAAARNRGVLESRCGLVAFLDADDELLPGCLLAHVKCRELSPAARLSICSSRAIHLDGSTQEVRLADRVKGLRAVDEFYFTERLCAELTRYVYVGCVDRELFDEVGGFDEGLRSWEITDFNLRASLASPVVGIINDIYINVYETPGSQSTITHKDSKYMFSFAEKLLSLIGKIPQDQHEPIVKQIDSILGALWANGAIAEFKWLASKAERELSGCRPSHKLNMLGKLPETVLKVLYEVRKLKA